MRASGSLFLLLLMAIGVMLYLGGRDVSSSLDAVATVAADLREEGIEGRALDTEHAQHMIRAMEELLAAPETVPDHIEDLRTFAAVAAKWADAAPSPSSELRAAVALRRAAGELRTQALRPSTVHLMRARHYLGVAADALTVAGGVDDGPGPGLATDAVRDRLENLQQSHQERFQELDEELDQ